MGARGPGRPVFSSGTRCRPGWPVLTSTASLPVRIVTGQPELDHIAREIRGEQRIALDIESNGFHKYPERVCLVQMATSSRIYLIDPLAVPDLSPLGDALGDAGIEKVLHGADYDIRSLDREWGFRILNLFDTGIGAHFIGMTHLGLAGLLEEMLGKIVPKDKNLQRADWSLRPLAEDALAYAADDVESLFLLRDRLGERLASLGREEWAAEECSRLADVRYVPPDRETAFLSIKGAGALDPRGLAILRELVKYREEQARQRGRPPFRVLPDQALLFLARNPSADLAEVPGLNDYARQRLGQGMRHAIRVGCEAPPFRRPRGNREDVSREEMDRRQERLKTLKAWRTEEGVRLGLEPPLLWPTVGLERIAKSPETVRQEIDAPEVRRWQRRHVAPSLLARFSPA